MQTEIEMRVVGARSRFTEADYKSPPSGIDKELVVSVEEKGVMKM